MAAGETAASARLAASVLRSMATLSAGSAVTAVTVGGPR